MQKNIKARGVVISKFVNVREKDKTLNSLQDLIREGLVQDYKFVYTKPKDEEKKKYISSRIVKLDLYHGIVTTANGNMFKILNDIDVNPKKKAEE